MDWKNQMMNMKKHIFQISEYWYLGMLVLLAVYRTLTYAWIDVVWADLGKGIPVIHFLVTYLLLNPNRILLALALIRHLCADRYELREMCAAVLICYLTSKAVDVNRHEEVMTMILLMIGAWGMSFRKLLKVYFIAVFAVVAGVFLASQIGLIENLVYQLGGRRLRMAFGFSYPTRFASHLFFLLLWYWYLRDSRLKSIEAALPMVAGVLVWWFCDARLNALCLVLMAGLMLYQIFFMKRKRKLGIKPSVIPWYAGGLSLSSIIASGIIMAATVFYRQDHALLNRLDMLISRRLSMTQKAMDIYGFHIWGKKILMAGNGGHITGAAKYFYIDSALMQFALRYGLVMLVLLVVLFWIVGIRAEKRGDLILLWVLALVSLHAMIEPQMIELQYCPLLLAVFADFSENRAERTDHEET